MLIQAKPLPGSPQYIIAQAALRKLGGQPPVLTFRGFTDPVEALAVAHNLAAGGKDYEAMTKDELQAAARNILTTSWSEGEARSRIRVELGYSQYVQILWDGAGYTGQMFALDGTILSI